MKSNTVNRNDYELYVMNVPLTLFGKKRRQYIKRELEKVHPCFSEQFSFDAKRCIRKGKVQTLIAVMDKVKLLEYKRNRKASLRLEGINAGRMFPELPVAAAVIAAVLVLAAVISAFAGSGRSKKSAVSPVPSVPAVHDFVSVAEPVSVSYGSRSHVLEEAFGTIRDGGGKISRLTLECGGDADGDFVLLNLSLKKMYPEVLLSQSESEPGQIRDISPVSYAGGNPSFEYSLKARVQDEEFMPLETERVSSLRSELGKFCSIREENFLDASFRCELPEENFAPFFDALSLDEGLCISGLSVSKISGGFDLSVSFACPDGGDGKNLCRVLSDYAGLFAEEKKPVPQKRPAVVAVANAVSQSQEPSVKREQIGRVVQKNGKTIVYYRDEKNQIRGVEE